MLALDATLPVPSTVCGVEASTIEASGGHIVEDSPVISKTSPSVSDSIARPAPEIEAGSVASGTGIG